MFPACAHDQSKLEKALPGNKHRFKQEGKFHIVPYVT